MTGSDIAQVIAAVGGAGALVTAVGNVIVNIMTLKQAQANSTKIDSNTGVTQDAKHAAALAASAATVAAEKAQQAVVVNTAAMAQVSAALDGQTDKLVASALAQGHAEGRVAGVAAEQERLSQSGKFPALPVKP